MHFPKVIISQESRRNHGSVVSCWNSFLPRKRIIPGWQLDFGFGFLVTKNRELSFYENYPLAKKSRKENHGKVFFIMTFKIFSRNDASSILRICFFVQNSRIGVKNEISESWFTILSWNYIYCHIIISGETNYACNVGCERDQICLQSWFKRGLNMPAIMVTKGTNYACNLGNDGD